MVENANRNTAKAKMYGNHDIWLPKASDVNWAPAMPSTSCIPVKINTNAVNVHTTTVSIKGSSKATKPSEGGLLVFAVLWAMAAEPTPASLEKAARWNPMTNTPKMPPFSAEGLNAPSKMAEKAGPMFWMFIMMTAKAANM